MLIANFNEREGAAGHKLARCNPVEQSSMHLAEPQTTAKRPRQRRKFPRYDIQCRARIVIGPRHYTGYLHNISQGCAKLRTITPIGKLGSVLLRLPDLPPLRCQLRWTDAYNAGVAFELALTRSTLSEWAESRSAHGETWCDIAKVDAKAG